MRTRPAPLPSTSTAKPCVLETPGPSRQGPTPEQVALAFALRKRGRAARAAQARRLATDTSPASP